MEMCYVTRPANLSNLSKAQDSTLVCGNTSRGTHMERKHWQSNKNQEPSQAPISKLNQWVSVTSHKVLLTFGKNSIWLYKK